MSSISKPNPKAMHIDEFDYTLPPQLIADYPLSDRSASRLLRLNPNAGQYQDGQFTDLLKLLSPGDLLVFNNTKVIPARLFGQKATGGKVEVLVERMLGSQQVLAHCRSSKSPKPGSLLLFEGGLSVLVGGRQGDLFELTFSPEKTVLQWLESLGHMPLPPYIQRSDEQSDQSRYQTVYAKDPGAVAAPTAGLHFDQVLLDALAEKGIQQSFLTLHVGAGTFQPVRVEQIQDHHMHAEMIDVPLAVCEQIRATKANGGKVVAVGTTSVRALESAAHPTHIIEPMVGDTDIFITPGYSFKVVDALITNFHLPKSTLLMLVSALAGHALTRQAYAHAIAEQYRFYSYGDAMLIGDF